MLKTCTPQRATLLTSTESVAPTDIGMQVQHEADCRQDHSCNCHHNSDGNRFRVYRAVQVASKKEDGTVQECIRQPRPAFLRIFRTYSCSRAHIQGYILVTLEQASACVKSLEMRNNSCLRVWICQVSRSLCLNTGHAEPCNHAKYFLSCASGAGSACCWTRFALVILIIYLQLFLA